MGAGRMGDLNELVERLQAGLVLVGESESDEGTIELFDTDAATTTMDEAAAALTSLMAERDGLAAALRRVQDSNSRMAHDYGKLTSRAQAAEAQLKAAREVIDQFCQINCQDAQAIADAQIAAGQEPKP